MMGSNLCPEALKADDSWCRLYLLILSQHLVRMFSGAVHEATKLIATERSELIHDGNPEGVNQQEDLPAEEEKREVNAFVGWAIHELRVEVGLKKHGLDKRRSASQGDDAGKSSHDDNDHDDNDDDENDDENDEMLAYLEGMRVFHDRAVLDEEYMRECYSLFHRMINNGWLTLVSKALFPFGRNLMRKIRDVCNDKAIRQHGNQSSIKAFEQLMGDSQLEEQFYLAHGDGVGRPLKRKVYCKLVKKVFHARFGAEFDKFKEKHTGRHVKGCQDLPFRLQLRAMTQKGTVENAKRHGHGEDDNDKKRPAKRKKG